MSLCETCISDSDVHLQGLSCECQSPSGKATDLMQAAGAVCLAGEETEVQWGRERWECPECWAWRKETTGHPAAVTIGGRQAAQGGPPSGVTGSAL